MTLWLFALCLPRSYAFPVARSLEQHAPRAESSGNSASPKIIVPVVIGIIAAIMIVGFGWWKRRNRTRELINSVRNASTTATNNANNRTANANGTTQPSTTATAGASPRTGPDAPPRPPRRRRRRRPSQISTKSLPAYNEQAGDEEIVLVRRNERDSMSDDDDDDDDDESRTNRRSANATPAADSVPLLEDSSPDMPRVSLASSTRDRSMGDHPASPTTTHEPNTTAPSVVEADVTQTEANTTVDTITTAPHPDEVPAYDEAVDTHHAQSTSATSDPQPSEASTGSHIRQPTDENAPPADGDAQNTLRPKRKSVFRQFFALHRQGSTSERPESVELAAPGRPSITLSTPPSNPRSSTSVSGHRPSASGSTHRPSASVSTVASGGRGHTLSPSLSSLILTRSRSPTRSTDSLAQRLNISAPISTTLVRTEISYPRAGPTPEQIRFLSSRESLGRFGMPYGEEAIAAARSRETLSGLPPQYETEAGNSSLSVESITSPAASRRGPILYTPGELALRRTETSTTAPPEPEGTDPERATERIELDPDSERIESTEPPTQRTEAASELERVELTSERAEPTSEPIQPKPESTVIDSQASVSPQSAHLRRSPSTDTSIALPIGDGSIAPEPNRRESVYTTRSFVTASEGDETETEDIFESSPPTPTASTYREFGAAARSTGQMVLIPEPSDALHPELILLPATPTSTISSHRDRSA